MGTWVGLSVSVYIFPQSFRCDLDFDAGKFSFPLTLFLFSFFFSDGMELWIFCLPANMERRNCSLFALSALQAQSKCRSFRFQQQIEFLDKFDTRLLSTSSHCLD